MSHKYAPPFATLASVQNAGGAYMWDVTISLAIMPPLPVPIKHDLIVGGGWGPSVRHRRVRGGEMLLSLQVGWQALTLRGKEARRFRELAGVPSLMRAVRVYTEKYLGLNGKSNYVKGSKFHMSMHLLPSGGVYQCPRIHQGPPILWILTHTRKSCGKFLKEVPNWEGHKFTVLPFRPTHFY